jgi:hypothetical protein
MSIIDTSVISNHIWYNNEIIYNYNYTLRKYNLSNLKKWKICKMAMPKRFSQGSMLKKIYKILI